MQVIDDRKLGVRVEIEARGRATRISIELRNLNAEGRRSAALTAAAFGVALAERLRRVTIPPGAGGGRTAAGDACPADCSSPPLQQSTVRRARAQG